MRTVWSSIRSESRVGVGLQNKGFRDRIWSNRDPGQRQTWMGLGNQNWAWRTKKGFKITPRQNIVRSGVGLKVLGQGLRSLKGMSTGQTGVRGGGIGSKGVGARAGPSLWTFPGLVPPCPHPSSPGRKGYSPRVLAPLRRWGR